jgi:hypothetical protein
MRSMVEGAATRTALSHSNRAETRPRHHLTAVPLPRDCLAGEDAD